VFAHQGYFVVAINPTGSTTFGQSKPLFRHVCPPEPPFDACFSTDFTDAITQDWGGKPFVDLQRGWKYALGKYPEIDPDRAVAAGASWGGYAIK
jgi:dipeptidyl aminopeptidase/acylaminoacyl peptidase